VSADWSTLSSQTKQLPCTMRGRQSGTIASPGPSPARQDSRGAGADSRMRCRRTWPVCHLRTGGSSGGQQGSGKQGATAQTSSECGGDGGASGEHTANGMPSQQWPHRLRCAAAPTACQTPCRPKLQPLLHPAATSTHSHLQGNQQAAAGSRQAAGRTAPCPEEGSQPLLPC
jgi:hypothetical protein